ncbi:hypothetical protein HZH66_007571 [Vespula vulgaris]|uniref:Uncharacterized protein n=1 Tax=Vespula vulgaris TaxID=7454 RepID=A0A834N6E5_VESVU|nr:hypothetical protein HZH66_007571 [Vespula vulgaris]
MNSCSVALEAYRYSAHVACSSQATGTNYLRYESTKNLLWVDKQQGERSPSLLHQQPVTSTKNLRIAPLDGYKHLICIETRLTLAIKRSTPRNSGQFSITKMANLESFHSVFPIKSNAYSTKAPLPPRKLQLQLASFVCK